MDHQSGVFIGTMRQNQTFDPNLLFLFQLATKVTTFFIEHFGMRDLFGRENYEYYARLTGRILKVEDEWIFFTYPPVISGSGRAGGMTGASEARTSRDDMDSSLDVLGASADVERAGKERCVYRGVSKNESASVWSHL